MPVLDRYVLRESVLPFILGFGLVTFLFVIDFLFDYLDLILTKGVPPLIVGELFLLALGWITALSLPCGVLVAALMTFGRLAQDNEVTAMRGLGVNPARILRGPLAAAAFLTLLMTLFNNYVLPETNHRFANLTLAIYRKAPTARVEAGVFMNAFDNYSLLVRGVNDRTGEISNITIYDYTQGKIPTTILAERGRLSYIEEGATLRLDLEDGEIHEVPGDAWEGKYRRLRFDHQTLWLHNAGAALKRTDRDSRGEREMNLSMMNASIDRLQTQIRTREERIEKRIAEAELTADELTEVEQGRRSIPGGFLGGLFGDNAPDTTDVAASPSVARIREAVHIDRTEIENLDRRIDNFRVEIHKKFSIPFACVVFVMLGGPLGIRMRRGGFANMAVAVGFFMVYYLLLIGGEQLADRRIVSPILAMWLPNMILGAVGIYFTVSVTGVGPGRGMR